MGQWNGFFLLYLFTKFLFDGKIKKKTFFPKKVRKIMNEKCPKQYLHFHCCRFLLVRPNKHRKCGNFFSLFFAADTFCIPKASGTRTKDQIQTVNNNLHFVRCQSQKIAKTKTVLTVFLIKKLIAIYFDMSVVAVQHFQPCNWIIIRCVRWN